MTDITKERLLEKAWRFDIQYGPDGEANYAWVYNGKDLVATMRTHHADSIVEAMNRRAPVSALPGEAEVVAWRVKDYADGWILLHTEVEAKVEAENGNLIEPLVTLASLQAMQARAEKAERERDEALEQRNLTLTEMAGQTSRAEAAEAERDALRDEVQRLRAGLEQEGINHWKQRDRADAATEALGKSVDALKEAEDFAWRSRSRNGGERQRREVEYKRKVAIDAARPILDGGE